MRTCYRALAPIVIFILMTIPARAVDDPMQAGFESPPAEARPELFWDWMYDMVSREGITHDLEAMKRAGFAGALIMLVGDVDAHFHPAHNMPNPVKCMSPEFFAHWKFAGTFASGSDDQDDHGYSARGVSAMADIP